MRIVNTSTDIFTDYLLNMNTITLTFFSIIKNMLYRAINHYSLKFNEPLGKRHCSRQHRLMKKMLRVSISYYLSSQMKYNYSLTCSFSKREMSLPILRTYHCKKN